MQKTRSTDVDSEKGDDTAKKPNKQENKEEKQEEVTTNT